MNFSKTYSITQIKNMIENGFTDDFISYLCRAPQSVIDIVDSWNKDSNQSILTLIENYKNTQNEAVEEIAEDGEVAQEEIEVVTLDESPYKDQVLKDRITVECICVFIVSELECPEDKVPLRKIQVMSRRADGSIYSVMLDCCDTCKRLYLHKNAAKDKRRLFRKKQIKYEFKETE